MQGAAPCGVPAHGPDDQLREMLAELPSGRSDKAALRKKTTKPSQPLTISSAQDTRSPHSRSEVSQHGVSWEQHRWGTHTDAPPPLPRGETHSIGAGRAMGRPSPVHARPGTPSSRGSLLGDKAQHRPHFLWFRQHPARFRGAGLTGRRASGGRSPRTSPRCFASLTKLSAPPQPARGPVPSTDLCPSSVYRLPVYLSIHPSIGRPSIPDLCIFHLSAICHRPYPSTRHPPTLPSPDRHTQVGRQTGPIGSVAEDAD